MIYNLNTDHESPSSLFHLEILNSDFLTKFWRNHDQNFKLCTHYENNFDQNFFSFSKLFIEPNFWTNFRFRLIWNSVCLSLFGQPRFGLIGNSVQLSPLVFVGCCNFAFFIMEASTDQKNFHVILDKMFLKPHFDYTWDVS